MTPYRPYSHNYNYNSGSDCQRCKTQSVWMLSGCGPATTRQIRTVETCKPTTPGAGSGSVGAGSGGSTAETGFKKGSINRRDSQRKGGDSSLTSGKHQQTWGGKLRERREGNSVISARESGGLHLTLSRARPSSAHLSTNNSVRPRSGLASPRV